MRDWPFSMAGLHVACCGKSKMEHSTEAETDVPEPGAISRRTFLGTAAGAMLAAWYATLSPEVLAATSGLPRAGRMGELNTTQPGGIDLYLDKQPLLIAGKPGNAITTNGSIPGPVIRMQQGKEAVIRVHNRMDESASIHWHGLQLPFTMDGVPGISFPGIEAHSTFTYKYLVRNSGTFWYHSHTDTQEQLGHYGQLILEPQEPDPVQHDVEYTLVLSDWTFEDPKVVLRNLKTIEGYYNFQRPTVANIDNQMRNTGKSFGEVMAKRLRWKDMRMDPTDLLDVTGITYTYLMNGLAPHENWTAVAKAGQRVRLRIVNASAQTYFDVRIPGLPMTVVNADSHNVQPVETDELRIAVAETYDVIVTPPDNRPRTIFAETMDRSGYARGTIAPRDGMRAAVPKRRPRPMLTMEDMGMMHAGGKMGDMKMGSGGMEHEMDRGKPGVHDQHDSTPHAATRDRQLPTSNLPGRIKHGPDHHGPGSITMAKTAYRQLDDPGVGLGDDGRRVLTYGQLKALRTPADRRPPTREFDLHLTGNMHKFIWGFDGKKFAESDMIRFQYGERLRINMVNDTMMSHPIHLHGMFMDLCNGAAYSEIPRKHTVNVQPAELLTVDITADAPGQWAFHCHLLYHMEAGMFRTVAVVRSLEGGPTDANA